jgi:hypothetical protein
VTRPELPNLILLLYSDRADAVASVLLEQALRLRREVLAMSLSQLINEVIVGRTWKWAQRTIDPSRTAVVNRLLSVDGATNPFQSPIQRQQFWIWLAEALRSFAYVSSMPSATSPVGSFGSLADQWSDLPELVSGLQVPSHRAKGSTAELRGDVYVVDPWQLYNLGRRAAIEPGPTGRTEQLAYVRPAGRLFHVAQVGNAIIIPNAPPGMRREQHDHVVSFTRSMSALSPNRILEHAFFEGNEVPVFYSTCPIPVVTGRLPQYADLVVTGLQDDIENSSQRTVARS